MNLVQLYNLIDEGKATAVDVSDDEDAAMMRDTEDTTVCCITRYEAPGADVIVTKGTFFDEQKKWEAYYDKHADESMYIDKGKNKIDIAMSIYERIHACMIEYYHVPQQAN